MQSLSVRCLMALAYFSLFDSCQSDTVESEGASSHGKFEIFPPEIFSGTDGVHSFKAPIITVHNPGPVMWTIADPSIAQIAPQDAENIHLMVTVSKPGSTTITAKSGDQM